MSRFNGIVLFLVTILWAVTFAVFCAKNDQSGKKQAIYENRRFDSVEINSVITYVNRGHYNGEEFKVASNPEEAYCAHIFFCNKYESKEFKYFANVGDSLIKHPFSDTLILIKQGEKYYYSFFKYHE